MLSSWMGSDFTNDDLVRSSDLLRDYTGTITKKQKKDGIEQAKVVLIPKPDAPVVWGKLVIWVRTKDLLPTRQEYYNERGKLMRVMEFLKYKKMSGRLYPSVMKMKSLSKPGFSTELHSLSINFNQKINRRIFTQRNLKKRSW